MSQQGKVFKKRYCRNIKTLRLGRQKLLSGNFQCENDAEGEMVHTTILWEH